ncbi:MAG TPA: Zn-ribbon containing protein [Candidatus Nanoarchaeia archaeon]|nr:Zn-ribbon containing protein [Candidatus Nanoarchaeia archaeon]
MHQCVKCGKIYEDGSNQILKGCSDCSGRFFFFVRNEALKKVQEVTQSLSKEDRERIEEDVKDIIGLADEDVPVILDLASINVLKPGKFELDLVRLFKGDPLVYKLADGKYIIDVAATFMQTRKEE